MAEKKKSKKAAPKATKPLGATYETGVPTESLSWRDKLWDRKEMLKYLKTGERYWYAKEGYGSEKRNKPA